MKIRDLKMPAGGYWKGITLAVILGLAAYFMAGPNETIDPLVAGIILGMIIRTSIGRWPSFSPGLEVAPRIFIPLGVISYGINLKFHRLAEVPYIYWLQLAFGIVAVFLVAIYLGKRLRLKNSIGLLIATGTAICGASAIAITAPVIKADSEDSGSSLITITIFGLFGLLIYPLAVTFFALTKTEYAILCSTTLHMTGLVKAAASVLGDGCLKIALSIKMARTALIIPIIGFLGWISNKNGRPKTPILSNIPWFMWAFVAVGLITSFVFDSPALTEQLRPWAGIFFTIALTSIGLTVDLKRILNFGGAPLIVGLCCWAAAIAVFIISAILTTELPVPAW